MSRMVVVKADLGMPRLPTGKIMKMHTDDGLTSSGRIRPIRTQVLMLVTEEVLEEEILTKQYKGVTVLRFRTGEPIPEEFQLDDYLGTIDEVHFFISSKGDKA